MTMIHQTMRFTRPSINVPFYVTDDAVQLLQAQHEQEGRYHDRMFAYSPDGLEMLVTFIWNSREDKNYVLTHPLIAEHIAARNAYNVTHGIVKFNESFEL